MYISGEEGVCKGEGDEGLEGTGIKGSGSFNALLFSCKIGMFILPAGRLNGAVEPLVPRTHSFDVTL